MMDLWMGRTVAGWPGVVRGGVVKGSGALGRDGGTAVAGVVVALGGGGGAVADTTVSNPFGWPLSFMPPMKPETGSMRGGTSTSAVAVDVIIAAAAGAGAGALSLIHI